MRRLVLAAALVSAALADAAPAATPPRMETRWPGVHLVWYDDLNLKTVVAEFDRFLAVVEVPHDDATARSLLGLLREKFPDKPVRFALHTHHHDHSLGAVDGLLAAGVTVVTTPWNLEQVKGLASDPAAFEKRALTIRDELTLADGTNELHAYVLPKEKYELPADEYVVVEFPLAKALVSGCLFNKPLTYYEVVNARKTSLDRFLSDSKLDVSWLVPTNSAKGSGFEDVCARSVLTETLQKGIRPEEVADRLQARSVEELRRDVGALAEEFRAKSPRSYDLLVCGNYVKLKRKDYERAAILFEVAARLFPSEADPLWYLGETWSLAGDKAKAREAWTKALGVATKDEDRQRIREALEKLGE
jgi:hypothetical protein